MTPEQLKQIRNNLGLSTAQMAEKLRVHQRLVQRMENGTAKITDRTIAYLQLLLESNKETT